MSKFSPKAVVQSINITDDDLKFKTPSSICISGPSMSGKSEFIVKLLVNKDKMFDVNFEQVLYCAPESLILRHNPIFEKIKVSFPGAQIVSGLPDISKLNLNIDTRPKLIIIDDLMNEFLNSEAMVHLMAVQGHHFNITTIFTLQNFFAPSRYGKTSPRNANYKVVFFNRTDVTEIRNISMQICPQQPRFLIESFEFLKREFSEPPYILIDGHTHSPLKELFVRSQIFPTEGGKFRPIFFFPK
ncbi:MAG: hypothetical protein FJ333_08310 [Sphingomonadales bacterium]|nr:hypothetical protein [Sphingomonadales bacterium]